MKTVLSFFMLFTGIVFNGFSQINGIIKVNYDPLHKKVIYVQTEMTDADSVETIGMKLDALDEFIRINKPEKEVALIIEKEKEVLVAERTRIIVADHPERLRQ